MRRIMRKIVAGEERRSVGRFEYFGGTWCG